MTNASVAAALTAGAALSGGACRGIKRALKWDISFCQVGNIHQNGPPNVLKMRKVILMQEERSLIVWMVMDCQYNGFK